MKKLMAIVVSLALAIVSVLGSTGDALVYAQDTVLYQKETIFYGENFTVKYVIESQWNDEYIANVTITNTGDTTIENWELSYESADEYSNVWNAVVSYHSARNYNVKNAEHNQNIKPGESVSFGFQASFTGGKIDIPTSYKFLGDKLIVSNEECQVNFEVQSAWNNGCIMHVTMYNNSDENIEDWAMDWDFASNHKIDNIWRAKVESQEGTTHHLKNCEYNSIIKPNQKETFGMQISFPDGEIPQYPTNVVVSQFKKDKWYLDFDKEWNRKMIHADAASVVEASKVNKGSIKVGLIDSGVDYSQNINVVEDEDFVESYDDVNPLFADLSGHGTAVAALLGSDSSKGSTDYKFDNEYLQTLMDERIDGVNPYVDIYSARVLDEGNDTTIDQLVNGIEWAIEKDVKILNISCGVSSNSQKLYNVIKKAYNKGILIIAAAGDGDSVQYPAKYSEVMAVGSVKCNGKIAEDSATGSEIEVVAPGEDVTTYGPFGILTCYSGSSMAVPQVTALASILWQQDPTKSSEFIRRLIDATARPLGDETKYGYGLIDCEYALNQYNSFATTFANQQPTAASVNELLDGEGFVENNANVLRTDTEVVKGYWRGDEHEETVGKLNFARAGSTWPDDKTSTINGMMDHPRLHGYYKSNYIKAYKVITRMAKQTKNKGKYTLKKKADDFTRKLVNAVNGATRDTDKGNGFAKKGCTTKKQKALFLYGMALHGVADIFAHSSTSVSTKNKSEYKKIFDKKPKKIAKKWGRLKHGTKKNGKFVKKRNLADAPEIVVNRFESAKGVCGAIIDKTVSKFEVGTNADFENIIYYQTCKKAKSYKKTKKKKEYMRNTYGVLLLKKYLDHNDNKKLKKIIKNVSAANVKQVVKKWK